MLTHTTTSQLLQQHMALRIDRANQAVTLELTGSLSGTYTVLPSVWVVGLETFSGLSVVVLMDVRILDLCVCVCVCVCVLGNSYSHLTEIDRLFQFAYTPTTTT